ncbi:MAG: UDP-3-O-[3-hydroxymyristoyl] N-acetylglucosamine deacetylase [Bacteroidales bacterium]|nr:UDP-3-O-[3-hydroxymyristoyl] N-acetylglucosamine deacetylase [Bacteroidales bacterium]
MKQTTLRKSYKFSGKGLHTGKICNLEIHPAGEDFGIKFKRTDIGDDALIPALATFVTAVTRSTTLENNGASVITTEHLMSALSGLGVDNALVTLDNEELPILDGSAKPYVDAILADGLTEQNKEKVFFVVKEPFNYVDGDASIQVLPSDNFEAEITIDFHSQVLGIQKARFIGGKTDYATQIAPCRTFCFYHEIEALLQMNLIKGGDLDNALVVVEKDPSPESIQKFEELFGLKDIVAKRGYLSHCQPYFSNECARHKLLDLIGDFALIGYPIKGKIIASKTGHRINTAAVKQLIELYK